MKLRADNPAAIEGRTIHVGTRRAPDSVARILKPAAANAKLGGTVRKGRLRGLPMFSLTLEERATCPRSCAQWLACYGNAMPFAHRITHGRALTARLRVELQDLARRHPAGFLVRLHVLGDFYSTAYVEFWGRMLRELPTLHVFGYTHWAPDSRVGRAIRQLDSDRAWIRFSDHADARAVSGMTAHVVQQWPAVRGEAIPCPEQTGATSSCATCGLCWSVRKPILFLVH